MKKLLKNQGDVTGGTSAEIRAGILRIFPRGIPEGTLGEIHREMTGGIHGCVTSADQFQEKPLEKFLNKSQEHFLEEPHRQFLEQSQLPKNPIRNFGGNPSGISIYISRLEFV